MSDDGRPVFEELLELAVYLPVGLALRALEEVPSLAAEGRARVGRQVDSARVVGRFAVGIAKSRAAQVFRQGRPATASRAASEDRRPADPAKASGQSAGRSTTANAASSSTTHAKAASPPRSGRPVAQRSRLTQPSSGDVPSSPLAIPGYDALSASQVVPRLTGLMPDELAAIGRYEMATRRRRTILGRIAQLETASGDRAP